MKEYKIEIYVDEKGNIKAETFGMQDPICADELDKALKDIVGEREVKKTGDYGKSQSTKQTIKRG